ncbi:hypothetical protein DH09_00845 (plasmid) [Bacillaceae bacterium JMAK1]|nr:hypothetical protein DH09_00845 [Bacillaceae bacterium JMAK1]
MKKQISILLVLSFTLTGCFNNDTHSEEEVDSEAGDNTLGNEEIDELSNEQEHNRYGESEDGVDSVAPEPVVHTEIFEREGEEVEVGVTVHPIEREGDLAIFTVEFEKLSGEARIGLDHMLSHPSTTRTSNQSTARGNQYDRLGYQIRLLDSTNDTISHTLFYQEYRDDRGDEYLSTHALKSEEIDNREFNEGNIVSYSAVFNAPKEEQVHVMMESFDLILDVPVVQSDEVINTAEAFLYENVLDTTSTSLQDLTEQTYPLQTYNESVNDPVGTLAEEGQASITLDSDVLFEFDSSELQDDAENILEATAEELTRVNGGDLIIVGHTDDQGDEVYNQKLSESRAQSVHDELETIIDLAVFDVVETEGRSYNEPIASNEDEEGQQLNRRVEFHFSQPEDMVEVTEEEFELPDNLGPVAAYKDGDVIEVEYNNNPLGVSIDSLKRLDGYIIGRVRLHNTSDRSSHIHNPVNIGYGHGVRSLHVDGDALTSGGFLDNYDANGVTLLYGDKRVFPIDYWALTAYDEVEKGTEELTPLTHRNVREGSGNTLGEGGAMVVTIIWPDVPGETITVDKAPSDNFDLNIDQWLAYLVPWRITDVPINTDIENGESSGSNESTG